MSETVSVLDVQARWAYSEIVGARSSRSYDSQAITGLRAKRQSGVPFSELTSEDRYQLALNCACVRCGLLMFLTGVERFCEDRLTRVQIAAFLVPPNVSGLPNLMPFGAFMETPSTGPDDPRSEHAEYTRVPDDPLTVGRFLHFPVLLDGYHRAASFWKSAPPGAQIPAYVPHAAAAPTINVAGW